MPSRSTDLGVGRRYSAPELYELLVMRRGMTLRRYARFVADAMAAALL